MPELPARCGVVGCGVIGAAWAARMRLRGVDVAAYDPSPSASKILDAVMIDAVAAWQALGLDTDHVGSLTIVDSIAEAADGAGLIQESVPERLDIKHSTLAAIDAAAPLDALMHRRRRATSRPTSPPR